MDKKLKILVVTGWYPSVLEPLNGDFVKDQVRLLREEGLKIDMAYADLNIAYLKKGLVSKRSRIVSDVNENKDYIITSAFWPKNSSIGLKKWIESYASWVAYYISKEGPPDLIHAHTYLGAMVSQKINEARGIPYIVTEHYTGWLDGSIRSLHKSLAVSALGNAKKVIAVSHQLADQLKKHTSREIDTLPNFIDTELFQPGTNFNSYKKLIYIGDLIERKQVHLIIKTLSILESDYSLTIIGEGHLLKRLTELVTSLGLTERVTFLGCLSKREVARQLQSHDILVHPSKLESFGLTIVEALCCGLPVIAFENFGIEMMKGLSGLHICEKQTPIALAETIKSAFLKNTNNNKKIISAEARNRFSPGIYKSIVQEIYRSVID